MLSFLRRKLEGSAQESAPLPELSRVSAVTTIEHGGRVAPEGSTGTVVFVYDHGKAYEVEFTAPKHAVIFARREQLAAL